MDTPTSGNDSQAQPEADRLNIVDWIRKTDDLAEHLFEPELLSVYIAEILGVDSLDQCRIPITPADQLARLLIDFKEAVSADDRKRLQAIEMMERAIELCFISTPAYKAALDLYKMELAGEVYAGAWRAGALSDADSLYETITAIIERIKEQNARDAADRESGPLAGSRIGERHTKVLRLPDRQRPDDEVCRKR